MSHLLPARWLVALAAITALTAFAQTAQPTAEAPGGPTAPTALTYHSAFDSYQRYQDDKPTAWKQANDTVHQRGGWRAYAQELQAPASEGHDDTQQPEPHAGHGMHHRPSAPAKTEQQP